MNVRRNYIWACIKKTALAISTLSLLLLFVGVAIPQIAHGQDRDDRDHRNMEKCQRRIEKAEARLHQEIQEHGDRSHQANRAWLQLRSERERCYSAYHQWWDGRDGRWHQDRDWDRDPRGDRDDHDRDRRPDGPGAYLQ
jgi:hypothetical protein